MVQKWVRMLCLLLILAALPLPMALADEGAQVYVYAYILKVYEKPSTKSEVIVCVSFACFFTKLAEKKDWAKVITPDNQTGYCSAKQLTESDPNTLDAVIYAQQDRAPVYQMPDVDAPMIGHLNRNDRAKMIAMTPTGDWLRIQYGEHDGYIQRPRVDYKRFSTGKAAWIVAEACSVYYDPAVDAAICSLNRGQKILLVIKVHGWAKIRSESGLVGYVRSEAVTTKRTRQ